MIFFQIFFSGVYRIMALFAPFYQTQRVIQACRNFTSTYVHLSILRRKSVAIFKPYILYTGKYSIYTLNTCFFQKKAIDFRRSIERCTQVLSRYSICLKYSLGLIVNVKQNHYSIYIGEKNFEKKSCRKWKFSNPIGNPSQIEKNRKI